MKFGLFILFLCVYLNGVTGICIAPTPLTLQMILEYAKWRSLEQIVLFDNIGPINCAMNYAKPLIRCLQDRGISLSIQSAKNPKLSEALFIRRDRIGSIVLLDGQNLTSPDNVLQLASQKLLFDYYRSWFLITVRNTDTVIDSLLRDLNIGIDSDVVIATTSLAPHEAAAVTHSYLNRTCFNLRNYSRTFKFRNIKGRKQDENSKKNLDYVIIKNNTVVFYLIHIYKIRNSDNTSLVVTPLGHWSPGLHSLKPPVSVKLRNDFNGYPIIVGVLNGSENSQTEKISEEETNDIVPLLEIITFVANSINASIDLVSHEKLGTMTNKAWSDLFGDVVSGTVDIGLGYITINDERQREMSFTYPLIRSMRNIYFHPPESGSMRDIFLRPFNNKLLMCVAMTYLMIVLAMGAINYTVRASAQLEDEKNAGLGEAALWCISIMCMQGSPWMPVSPSGKIVLMSSLIFALVTYNAYAGFITSILSVQASGIRTLSDLLENNFLLGYSFSEDEYIRNANDSNLRKLYIKAFNNRESRLDTILGLKKAVQGSYGFFVSATMARRALRTTLLHDRCSIKELVLPQTFTKVALPMSQYSPYIKIINLSILRMKERGVLERIGERMLPGMPQCEAPTTFHSARFADVYSAYVILVAGVVTAFGLGILERLWIKRRYVKKHIMHRVNIRRRENPILLPDNTTGSTFVETSTNVPENLLLGTHESLNPPNVPMDNSILRSRSPRIPNVEKQLTEGTDSTSKRNFRSSIKYSSSTSEVTVFPFQD
ncbi:Ionotropic receptor 102 [Cephus cinctus]|nr:glutamate receptor ionotropic, delta-2 isoform X2 [Cephus cinctus]XP_024938262.1 glutamate receptor ionotropic, delta-2 isoform X2 [Cephus cinctus]XP_024938264.1 glutamate receptor ionotropic, delta-2 isoform X2 [Cephus cinctus]XP_024938265.1 glutamate receptor ionotropic, delta-2 isoform X2 [Cephus cinctus]RLZ02168.1 Ionotropic receptor 102 [Cephus cinctus]